MRGTLVKENATTLIRTHKIHNINISPAGKWREFFLLLFNSFLI
ncbi:MAG: hypothetical protein ABSG15_04435 [FCB group bacterium]